MRRSTTASAGLLVVMALGAALAACGGASPTGASGTPASTPGGAGPTGPGTATSPPAQSPAAIPTLAADTPLADLLPATLDGGPMQRFAVNGDDLSQLDSEAAMIFGGIQNVLGKPASDMHIGIATGPTASVIALRVAGTSAQEISDAMIGVRVLNATTNRDELDVDGRQVVKIVTTTATTPFYVYAAGDVSFTIAATSEAIALEAIRQLP